MISAKGFAILDETIALYYARLEAEALLQCGQGEASPQGEPVREEPTLIEAQDTNPEKPASTTPV
jgi:hypothetical protein